MNDFEVVSSSTHFGSGLRCQSELTIDDSLSEFSNGCLVGDGDSGVTCTFGDNIALHPFGKITRRWGGFRVDEGDRRVYYLTRRSQTPGVPTWWTWISRPLEWIALFCHEAPLQYTTKLYTSRSQPLSDSKLKPMLPFSNPLPVRHEQVHEGDLGSLLGDMDNVVFKKMAMELSDVGWGVTPKSQP